MSFATGKGKGCGKQDVGASLLQIPNKVCARLEVTVQKVLRCNDFLKMKVCTMGSRYYGLQGPESDLDLYVVLTPEVFARAEEVLLRLAEDLMDCGLAESDPGRQPVVQTANSTLKWTAKNVGIDASLYLAGPNATGPKPWIASNCLRHFFVSNEACRLGVQDVLRRLRERAF